MCTAARGVLALAAAPRLRLELEELKRRFRPLREGPAALAGERDRAAAPDDAPARGCRAPFRRGIDGREAPSAPVTLAAAAAAACARAPRLAEPLLPADLAPCFCSARRCAKIAA